MTTTWIIIEIKHFLITIKVWKYEILKLKQSYQYQMKNSIDLNDLENELNEITVKAECAFTFKLENELG